MEYLYQLYKNDHNEENYNNLRTSYNDYPDNFIAFTGAGLSTAIKNVPTNLELYNKLCDKYSIRHNKIDRVEPKKFTNIYKKLNDKQKRSFDNTVFDFITPMETDSTNVHAAIVKTFNHFVTINYYDPIEHAFEIEYKKELKKYYFNFPGNQINEKQLIYLHGAKEIGFCILREADYKYFYPSQDNINKGVYVLENTLRRIFTENTVVFLGCSLESHIKKFLEILKQDPTSNLQEKKHYLIMNDIEIKDNLSRFKKIREDRYTEQELGLQEKEYFDEYEKIDIYPVVFATESQNDYRFVGRFCEALIREKEKPTEVRTDYVL